MSRLEIIKEAIKKRATRSVLFHGTSKSGLKGIQKSNKIIAEGGSNIVWTTSSRDEAEYYGHEKFKGGHVLHLDAKKLAKHPDVKYIDKTDGHIQLKDNVKHLRNVGDYTIKTTKGRGPKSTPREVDYKKQIKYHKSEYAKNPSMKEYMAMKPHEKKAADKKMKFHRGEIERLENLI